MSLLTHLKCFIKCERIPKEIQNELIVRIIFHPFHYSISSSKLKESAFLPPPKRNDVSVLRRDYTSDNFCKAHSFKVVFRNNQYCGMSTFQSSDIVSILKDGGFRFSVGLFATPLADKIVWLWNFIWYFRICKNDPGNPYHSDLIYGLDAVIEGEVYTEMRRYARILAKRAVYYNDPNPTSQDWEGQPLK